ncbi:glycoside hydrolase family 104 protein [Phaeobacter sp. HF9A]|uniref:glycoside hydrolase family 104 protein n=1 Tax=Phaeobacter sp. HF9A TaxID=2721561 RepID=UPI00142FDCC4|nr:glycoside hydrolase family 104 protein [Phaeobacter sp. HF9A]NIZ13636.1 glycoside hydrolase family 104 protein [Phaeobacter sp. HF9A]
MSLRTSPTPGALLAPLLLSLAWTTPVLSNSGGYSLVGDGGFFMRTSVPAAPTADLLGDDDTGHGAVSLNPQAASLFRGRSSGSLFATPPAVGIDVAEIMNVIASAEAGRADYDAVQHGAKIKPPADPTRMTLGEIYGWIEATPGQPHAIGRYQFIPATLKRLASNQQVPLGRRFSPALQDQLAHQLIEEAGLSAYKAGEMTQTAFMNNLAKIWAGLPTSSGKSYYHNYAGNRATVTWASFKAQMDEIFSG